MNRPGNLPTITMLGMPWARVNAPTRIQVLEVSGSITFIDGGIAVNDSVHGWRIVSYSADAQAFGEEIIAACGTAAVLTQQVLRPLA